MSPNFNVPNINMLHNKGLSTSIVSGGQSSEHTGFTKSSADQRLYPSMKKTLEGRLNY
jgi:hypothetical protein